MTRRRTVVLLAVVAVLGLVSSYVAVVAIRAGRIFNESPLSVIKDIVTHGSGSSVAQQVAAGRPTVLALYGYGGSGHDGAFLTDSILLVEIRPGAGGAVQVAEVSVPRDWFVPIALGNGTVVHERINSAYADVAEGIYPNLPSQYQGPFGGAHLADDTLASVLGIHVDHFVAMDFHAFQYVVDAVGGIDVNVQSSFTDAQYPHGECDAGDCAYTTVHFTAGPQHMDGSHALIYSRSRHGDNGEGTDFARSRRQQLVINAVKQKVVGVGGITELPAVLDALGSHVVTDLSVGDAYSLYDLVKGVPTTAVEHVSIDDQNFLYECGYPANCGAAYLFARDTTYRSIQHFIANVLPDPAALAEHAPITVLDGSGTGAGASGRWAGLLGELGFSARDGGTTARTPLTVVTGPPAGEGSRTSRWLDGYFGATGSGPPAPPGAGATSSPDAATPGAGTASSATGPTVGVTLVLGADEERAFNAGGPGDSTAGTGGTSGATGSGPAPTARPAARATAKAIPATPAPTLVPSRSPSPSPAPVPAPSPTPVVPPTPTPTPKHP